MPLPQKREVVVVGSGAAGSAMAARLAEGGKSVLLIEAGRHRSPSDLISNAIWARRLKWSGAPVLERGENPVGHTFNAGSGVGGSALHHYAVWPRLHPEDFTLRSRHDRALDWPLDYDDLAPYYDEVQAEVGIAGDAEREVWRPPGAPYPMPPVPMFAQGETIARGFERLGMQTAPLPLAVTSTAYRGRPPCLWDGWCDAGCPIGALANPLTIHLPKALAAGAELVTDTTVTRIITNVDGSRATGVEVVEGDGRLAVVHADVVILAAFSIQNPRLLLASANDRHRRGLANSSGKLGRYVMSHSAGLIYGLFDHDTQFYRGAFGGQLLNQDGYAKTTHADQGAFGSYQWMIAQAVKPNDLLGIGLTRADLFGQALHRFMQDARRGFATMTAVVEDLPMAENQVALSDRVDVHGVPLAMVTHTGDAASSALWRSTLTEGQAVFKAAGATRVWTGPQGAMHIMGGTIMGDNPADSVTNSYGQTHDVPNLLIAGPGLFPTSGGVNPTFTVHALAARSARYLLENWSSVVI